MKSARTLVTAVSVAVVLGFLSVPAGLAGQAGEAETAEASADTVYHLVLDDGSSFYGHIESRDEERVVFRTLGGVRLEVMRAQVRTLEPAEGRVVGGEVWPRDPNATRLFFGPTGRSLPSGEGYIGLFELFFSFGAVGVGDRLVLAAGTPVMPEVVGRVLYLAPKLRAVSVPGADLAVGALAFFFTESVDEGSVGIVYGVSTFGTGDDAVTTGAGWGFSLGADAALADDPVILLGGEKRASRRVKAITENYIVFNGGDVFTLVSGGVRFLGDRFSADVGAGGFLGGGEAFCCLPVLSASYTF